MGVHKIQMNYDCITDYTQNGFVIKNPLLTNINNGIFSYPTSEYLDDFYFIKYNGKLPYNCIFPHIYGMYSTSGIATASNYVVGHEPHEAFINNNNMWEVKNIANEILNYEFFEDKLIYKYSIVVYSTSTYPRKWNFEGYDVENGWEIIDSRIDLTYLDGPDFYIENPVKKYKKYRLNILENNGHASLIQIKQLQMYEIYDKLDSNNKIRIELSDNVKLFFTKKVNNDYYIYSQSQPQEFILQYPNIEYFVYYYLNDNGSIMFDVNNYMIPNNEMIPICKITKNIDNSIVDINKYHKQTVYDRLEIKTPVPTLRRDAVMSRIDTNIYYIGGTNALINNNDMYSILTDEWSIKTPALIAAGRASSSTFQNYIYVMGGFTTVLINNNDKYDSDLDTWSTNTNILESANYLSQVTSNDYIYSMFGAPINTNDKYSIVSDSWSTVTKPTPLNYTVSAVLHNNDIFCVSGYSINTMNENYNINTDTWQSKANIPDTGIGFADIINDYIVVRNRYLNLDVYSINTDTWNVYSNVFYYSNIRYARACAYQNRLYVFYSDNEVYYTPTYTF